MLLRGTASAAAGISKIEVKAGTGKFKRIKSGSRWSSRVRLAEGTNRVLVKLTDGLKRSTVRSVTITRE